MASSVPAGEKMEGGRHHGPDFQSGLLPGPPGVDFGASEAGVWGALTPSLALGFLTMCFGT